MLHIVPTPVGNLEDITLRAIRVLKEADLILAEDTRTSAVLLRHYDIRTPMRAHHRNNEHAAVEGIVADLGGRSRHSADFRCRHSRNIRSGIHACQSRARRRRGG